MRTAQPQCRFLGWVLASEEPCWKLLFWPHWSRCSLISSHHFTPGCRCPGSASAASGFSTFLTFSTTIWQDPSSNVTSSLKAFHPSRSYHSLSLLALSYCSSPSCSLNTYVNARLSVIWQDADFAYKDHFWFYFVLPELSTEVSTE